MSEIVPHKKIAERGRFLRKYKVPLSRIDYKNEVGGVEVELQNHIRGHGTCLGCREAPCMTRGEEDSPLHDIFKEFPSDPSLEICPTQAIIQEESGEISIASSECIGCGLCVARCPYGAISFNQEGIACVEKSDPDNLTIPNADHNDNVKHKRPIRSGQIDIVSSSRLLKILEATNKLSNQRKMQFVRNLLAACGVTCRIRRSGDTNVRMDGILELTNRRLGVLEVELKNEVLNSPRALLEDVAVLHGRYGVDTSSIDPVSVIAKLPNKRSEYYQVVNDIGKILDLHIRTITIGILLVILWQFKNIDSFAGDLFMIPSSDSSLLPSVNKYLGATVLETDLYPGACRPVK